MKRDCAYGDLYVMQAECGLIKVGRSVNPERRRRQLMELVRQRMEVVLIIPDQGREEDRILRSMQARFSAFIVAEWFWPAPANKRKLEANLGVGLITWPFKPNKQAMSTLADRLTALAFVGHLRHRRRRVIADIQSGNIYVIRDRRLQNEHVRTAISHDYCLLLFRGRFIVGKLCDEPVLDYLGNLDAARTIGPEGWEYPEGASAPETVIAGLRALSAWERALATEK